MTSNATNHAPHRGTPANAPHAKWLKLAARGNLTVGELFSAAGQLQAQGLVAQSVELYRAWLDKSPRAPLAYAARFNLAVTLSNSGDEAAAEAEYRKAIALQRNFIEARLNLGTLLEKLGRPDEALATWREILGPDVKLDPVAGRALYVQTLNNLGRLLEIRKQYPAAEEMLARSLHADPRQPNVMTHWVHLRQKQCAWPVFQPFDAITVEDMINGTSALAMLSLSDDPQRQLAAARRFIAEKVNADVAPLTGEHGYDHPRLRIGYLSSDFCSHAVSILTAELYELHDREQVEVYAFSWSREDHSPLRARVVRAMDHYIRIDALSDEQAARLIRSHEIDILVDLHGLTSGARPNILAYRPAPVAMTYLGFPGSTGLPGVDYVIADAFLIPPEHAANFSETPLYLPDTFQINDRQRAIAPRPTRASVSLPDAAFVFCSFNNNFKISPTLFAVWMSILRRVPGSVLWLVADYDEIRENLWRHAEAAGIARERLIFATRAVPAEYLARYQLADLFLDTYPFNAGTTASDALWAGLPILTCAGRTFASRMAGSLLRAVELPDDLITYNFADYEERAVALAADPARIAAMKQQLDANRLTCALFDSPRLVRNLEALMRRVAKAPAGRAPSPTIPESPSSMSIDQIPIITVTFNTPDLIGALLRTLREHYQNPVYVIDGSTPEVADQIKLVTDRYQNVTLIPFGYNIHHGPGMAWAIDNLGLSGRVLFLDSDVEVLKRGFLESLAERLEPQMYGVGATQPVNERGQPAPEGGIPYLHPACMLCNLDVVRAWPRPIKHGAPMLPAMLALARAGRSDLLGAVDWVANDFAHEVSERIFIKHVWRGTVLRTGGYHYKQPLALSQANTTLMAFMPMNAVKVVEVGCGDGSFANVYKQYNPVCDYNGIERDTDPTALALAREHCDFVFTTDIEAADPQREQRTAGANCWVLDGELERMVDPWTTLARIRASIAADGIVVAMVRNAQHWSRQVRLNMGDLRYMPGGPQEKTELRQFTRGTLLAMFEQAGFRVTGGAPLIDEEPGREAFLPALRQLALAGGSDPEIAVQDALAHHYIIVAVAA